MSLAEEIKGFFEGDVQDDDATLSTYSHDASLFEVRPQVVVFPKHAADISRLVKFVAQKKSADSAGGTENIGTDGRKLSVSVRAAGSCMSGGSLSESIVVDVTKYMHGIKRLVKDEAVVLPGTFYRDFEPETLKIDSILPCYTASKNLCALGGMIGNNCGGEKTLQYGKMEDYVKELKVIFSDGNEYTVKPLTKSELDSKIAQGDFEGNIYKNIFELIRVHEAELAAAKPKVSKNSAGYYLWNVWNAETGIFDLTKLIVGSQGTLGIVTEATLKLVPVKKISKLLVVFMPSLNGLGDVVNEILAMKPESVESYDDQTMKMAVKFMPEMLRSMKAGNFLKLMFGFLPEAFMVLTGGMPKLILLAEFAGNDDQALGHTVNNLENQIKTKFASLKLKTRAVHSASDAEKYWTIRRESFNLLRKHVRGMRTAPFIDDVVVRPEVLPEFLPKMRAILDKHKLIYTIAGHAGNGNFHIIPLMDMKKGSNRDLVRIVSDEVFDLVLGLKGSITGEHNDGIVRTPYLEKMFGSSITALFAQTKNIFDSATLFNPGKKVGGSIEYMESHIASV